MHLLRTDLSQVPVLLVEFLVSEFSDAVWKYFPWILGICVCCYCNFLMLCQSISLEYWGLCVGCKGTLSSHSSFDEDALKWCKEIKARPTPTHEPPTSIRMREDTATEIVELRMLPNMESTHSEGSKSPKFPNVHKPVLLVDIYMYKISAMMEQLVPWVFWISYFLNRFYNILPCRVIFLA